MGLLKGLLLGTITPFSNISQISSQMASSLCGAILYGAILNGFASPMSMWESTPTAVPNGPKVVRTHLCNHKSKFAIFPLFRYSRVQGQLNLKFCLFLVRIFRLFRRSLTLCQDRVPFCKRMRHLPAEVHGHL